jgi:putative membrane protein
MSDEEWLMTELTGFDGGVLAVLAHLGIPDARLIGRGNEGRVYQYGDDRVVKIYQRASAVELERLAAFLATLAQQELPFRTPQILEIGLLDRTTFTIERRLPGETLEGRFSALSPARQRLALTNYFLAAGAIGRVELADRPYGHVLPLPDDDGGVIAASTWGTFLQRQVARSLELAGADLAQDVEGLGDKVQELLGLVRTYLNRAPKRLVHADYFLGNVLFDRDLRVSAVLDFGAHTLVGDPRLDLAGAIAFLALDSAHRPWHIEFVTARADEQAGRDWRPIASLYTLYYSIYYANTKRSDPLSYRWCTRNLMDARLWQSARRCATGAAGEDVHE